jgi:sRNA-binding carbon storage regulator CsrA
MKPRYVDLKEDETVLLRLEDGTEVEIMLVAIDPVRVNQAKLGLTAPKEIRVLRSELVRGVSAP